MTEPFAWPPGETAMARRIRKTDWSATPLGPVRDWPPEVRSLLMMMLGAPLPMNMYLGRDLLLLYNDPACEIFGDKHTAALGRPARETFPEVWETMGDRLERVLAEGRPLTLEDIPTALGRNGTVQEAVFNLHSTPILRNGEGEPIGVISVYEEKTGTALTERAIRKSEERFRQFGDASPDVIWMIDATGERFEYISPAFETVWGVKRRRVLGDRSAMAKFIHSADRERVGQVAARVFSGERAQVDYRILRPDGEVRHIHEVGFAIREPDGDRIVRIGGIAQDRTDRVRQRKALEDSERRFRTLVEGIPQLVWSARDGAEWTWSSRQWAEFTGQSLEQSLGRGWVEAIHPDDRETACGSWRRAEAEGFFQSELRVRRASDGAYRWFQFQASLVENEGSVPDWLGTATDVEEMMELQERQKLLLAELQHRVRNLLAMVRSIIRQSAEGHKDVDDYVAHLTGRIDAMARTQVMLTRKAGAAIDLESLIRDELSRVAEEERLALSGPVVELSAKAAEVLTLAIHELATNSIKYGALGCEGRLAIRWFVTNRENGEWLEVMWEEACPDRVAEASRRGFGTELIEGRVPYELKGEGTMRVRPDGLLAEIAFPLEAGASILEPGPGCAEGGGE
ncbi:PAS domain S-box protein [Erythrobacter sp. HL-111]|uniref:PAS domain S-box protein n=1 Tax=Erythrobacter sp. HL-111 TaxID=1798193 RepID=UPI0006DB1B03|nr:PAS domain S-box protein [Erythrobacter sp. HL-111]KPP92201.1 MAG: two component signal transduction system histidine kinase with PAS sensory domain [Erythrobacteraceae bacterium HL-111]SDS39547.1 PAS domain S-box-containing protein [Erythrobacter sp. HL-111]